MLSFFLILVWLTLLIFWADVLVKGSASISKRLWIPQIVIGLTIVAFWTSAPELVINVLSAFNGTTDLAIGNVVGSNIWNILLILWISLAISDIKVHQNTAWKEIPFAILSAGILYFMTSDILFDQQSSNILTRVEWLTLLGFFLIFLYYVVAMSLGGKNEETTQIQDYPIKKALFLSIIGLVLLFIGGKILVENAVILARLAWISEMVIGLTIIAIWTSLPELVTCVIAARKGQTDIVIGNVIGSNIFNTFWILWITWSITPLRISPEAWFDIFFSFIITLSVFLFLFLEKDIYKNGWIINHMKRSEKYILRRWQGIILVIIYIAYITYLIYRG